MSRCRVHELLPIALLTASLALGGCSAPTTTTTGSPGSAALPSATGTAAAAADPYAHIPDIVEAVAPSVVTIFTDHAQGSGVIWNADGRIVTNNHVATSGSNLEVSLGSGGRLPATLLGTTPRLDLAVIKVDRTDLPAATFNPTEPKLGSLAIAIGDPLGFENSVTVGVVSGMHRSIPGAAQQSPALVDLLQTDAAISPGNSGGALVGPDGSIIGINVAYIPPTASAVAIGFAIPAATVIDAVPYLEKGEAVPLAWLGLSPVTLTPALAQRLGIDATTGAIVAEVAPGGPADQAGIKVEDVITAIGGQPIATAEDLLAALRMLKPGDTVDVTIER
ncbi:MAG: serine protease DegQ, partial [Chloroflexota bacterium]|nr:serine protease DegQ [Chloroflexota bacterium]